MKKHFVTAIAFLATTAAFAQNKDSVDNKKIVNKPAPAQTTTAAPGKKDWSKVVLGRHSSDHFMFQLGYDNWANAPDSMHSSGFNRSANFYFMFDFPFKNDPRLSLGAGLGIGTSNIYFHHIEPQVAAYTNTTLAFPSTDESNHYKKFKLVTTYLEIPLELRFAVDPEHSNSSWKFAVGAKAGLLMSAYTKGKTLQNAANQTIANYTVKESSKAFFSGSRLAATARISYGVFGVFGQFQVNSLLKSTAGPAVFPFSFGIMLSGL